jgi:hypothetical protein
LEQALDGLAPGEIGPALLLRNERFVLLRPSSAPAPERSPIRFELPAPREPDVVHFFSRPGHLNQLPQLAARAARDLGLDGALETQFRLLHEVEPSRRAVTRADFESSWRELQRGVEGLLGATPYAAYRNILNEQVEHILLSSEAGR